MDKASSSSSKIVGRVLAVTSFYSAFVEATGLLIAGRGFPLFLLVENSAFLILFLVVGFLSLRQRRAGFLGAGVVSLANFILLQGSPVVSFVSILDNPGGLAPPFALFLPFYVAMIVSVPYGFYGFFRAGKGQGSSRQISRSGLFAFVGIGMVIGGLLVGSFAAATESRLLSSGGTGDVVIVVGASSSTNQNFYQPANFTAKVGQSVTWINHDSAPHTVTSTSGAFDSGNMPPGATFSFSFTQPGVYHYTCNYHAWMNGTITVTAS